MAHADVERFRTEGFVVLPAHLAADELAAARSGLASVFPTAAGFHRDPGAAHHERFRSEFGGIVDFPFVDVDLSLLAVHPQLIAVAERLLDRRDLRVHSIEAWAKYSGAAEYAQPLHRDYLSHSLVVPAPRAPPDNIEMFVYLDDVPADLGPPAFVESRWTGRLPAMPNWYPAIPGVEDPEHPEWISADGHPDLYEHDVVAAGPAGTVVAYRNETLHRATRLSRPGGARFTLHVSMRLAGRDWITRRSWTDRANDAPWHAFVARATPRQLELFGFPPPGNPYWTPETLAGIAQRYTGLDVGPWAAAVSRRGPQQHRPL